MVAQARTPVRAGLPLPAMLIGVLFVALGALAFALLASNVASVITTVGDGEAGGETFLRFLNTYGILVPLLLIGAGVMLVRLGAAIMRGDGRSALWGRQILLWLIIAGVVFAVQSIVTALGGGIDAGGAWVRAALIVVGIVVAAAGYQWLGAHEDAFEARETLSDTSARTAWNLLVPTLVILLLVAMRPLEATFIYSLTNTRFASTQEAEFVGLDNYAQLLGFRFDSIACERAAAGGACALDADGATVYPRIRDVLGEDYRDLRYRDIGALQLGENQLVFSVRDRDFWDSIGNTLTFTVFSVTLELLFGLFVAMVINSKFTGRGLLRTAMLVPWAIPTVVSARLWDVMLRDNQSGVINAVLTRLGVIGQSQAWLANASLQIPALVAIDVWKTTPFMALILLAGLQTIPGDIYEAADVDGASKVRQFFTMTLPLLRPTIAVALVFRTLDAVRVFDVFQVLLGRSRLSMATYNYDALVNSQQLGYASAIGVVIFVIILAFTVGYVRILGVNAE